MDHRIYDLVESRKEDSTTERTEEWEKRKKPCKMRKGGDSTLKKMEGEG